MDVKVEKLTPLLEAEILPLMQALHQEVGEYPDWALEINWYPYQYAQDIDRLVVVTARKHGLLQGVLAFMVQEHPHYGMRLFAMQDIVYLAPALRGKMTAARMFKLAEKELKARGVEAYTTHTRTGEHFFGGFLEALGGHATEVTYTKRI